MTPLDCAKFLTVSSALTGREPTEEQAKAWSVILDDVTLEDALDALREHYRTSRFPVMPADIVAQVSLAKESADKDAKRAASRARLRRMNREHRERLVELGADPATLDPDDMPWPEYGWEGDDEPRRVQA